MKNFTNKYQLSKTLRFELKPQGKTLSYIQQHGLLEQDEHRGENYKLVKKIIDEYHKYFIDKSLCNFNLRYADEGNKDSLSEYYLYYNIRQRSDTEKELFKSIQKKMRKQIVDRLVKDEAYKHIDKKELIKEDLVVFIKGDTYKEMLRRKDIFKDYTDDQLCELQEVDLSLVKEFSNFTTYFTGFHENRKNMYSEEEKSTAIAYRLINENLPKFIDNINVFEKVSNTPVANNLLELYHDLEAYLNVNSINELFKLNYYSNLLTQTQIDVYNTVLGGISFDDGHKIKGLNEYINLYNQQHKERELRIPKLKPLYKQILSDRNDISFLPEEFKSDQEILDAIETCYKLLVDKVFFRAETDGVSLVTLLSNIKEYDLNRIYIRNDLQLTDISHKICGNWNFIQQAVERDYERTHPIRKKTVEKYEEDKRVFFKSFDSFSIAYINHCLDAMGASDIIPVELYFAAIGTADYNSQCKSNLFYEINCAYEEIKELFSTLYPEENNLAQDKTSVERIKKLLDSIKNLQHFVKPLIGCGDENDKDDKFYGEFSVLWDTLDKTITPLYNKVRNYVTRKPYSMEKRKLNFDNSTLLAGWDVNKECDNTSVLLRKKDLYYLAIMNKKHNKIFAVDDSVGNNAYYEKMEYKLLPGPNKMLPKVFFSKSRMDEFSPSSILLDNYKNETHKKGAKFNIDDCRGLIDFFKSSINKHEEWNKFGFKFSPTNTYDDLSGFYREVEQQGYKVSFRKISESYINQLVEEGQLYLFQIYNKDFSPYSKGTPNMHTLYWKALFDEHNLSDVVYKLNGQAEVFYRKSSLKPQSPTHPANVPIDNKNCLNNKKQSVFEYDLIKDQRFSLDKFQFHVPITLNFKAEGTTNINNQVSTWLKGTNSTYIIGIDRGERHLLYLSLIDPQGNIVKQMSLNEIVNEYKDNTYRTNYKDLLVLKEEGRDKARKSWNTIESIKELKEGYLSQVIHQIVQLMMQYNAIVVLENLNMGFKRGRQKVERQVYQKFEKMLIDKLNYLVDKNAAPNEPGGLLNALQLTNKFTSFKNMSGQNGFLFYIPAWNTSKIDPVTGFVNLFDTRYTNTEKAKLFFSKFDRIAYNSDKGWFEFEFDYNNFTTKAEGSRTNWTLCTWGQRIKSYRNPDQNNNWDSKEVDLSDEFKSFFMIYNIPIDGNLKDAILNQQTKAFYEGLLSLLRLTLQMRNSHVKSDVDYIVSPIADKNGKFFDSRNKNNKLPENADANGAYNIARKGLWIIKQIKEANDLKKLKLAISNKEWLQYAQGNDK